MQICAFAILQVCALSLCKATEKHGLMKKQQKAARLGRLSLLIAVGRLSLLIIKQVKLISHHRALSCFLLNCSNLKWFLSRWKFLAAAVSRKRKWLGAMIFDKNVTSYCRELGGPPCASRPWLPLLSRRETGPPSPRNAALPQRGKGKCLKEGCC